MKEKKETVGKVVEFAQSESSTKQFRPDYPISDELRDEMLYGVYRDFTKYVLYQTYAIHDPMLEEYIDDHHPRREKRQALEHNLLWWKVLYNASNKMSCVEDYLAESSYSLKPLITSWLREWDKAVPKFYYIGHKYNDRVLVVVDMLAEETLDVMVYDPTAVPPKKGEVVMGTLIPIGDALYFPIIDFYHFDLEASKAIASNLSYYYDKHLDTSTILEAFIHVLSILLQLERTISTENQESISSK